MSGIAGIFNLDGRPAELALLRAMTDAVSHRGPDSAGYWADGPVALGHRMLHSTPESLEESQPLLDETGDLCLVLDGRIDNREDLRAAIEQAGGRLRDRTDAELVLKAYGCWGEDCPARILGDFAFVVWDRRHRRLFCARDPLGMKPFYYYLDSHKFLWGSELHQVFEDPSIPREPNEPVIAEILSLSPSPQEETLYRNLFRLPQSHSMIVEAEGIRKVCYWDFDPHKEIRYRDDSEYADHFRHVFAEAVRCRLRVHGRAGSELSGGVDSSSVVCMAQSLFRDGRAEDNGFETFSGYFPGQPGDESDYVREVVGKWGIKANLVPPRTFSCDATREIVRRYRNLPCAPTVVIADALKALAQEKGFRALLTGHGGDDWFTGSSYHYADLLRKLKLRECIREAHDDQRANLISKPWSSLVGFGLRPLIPEAVRSPVRWLRKRASGQDGYPAWVDHEFAHKTRLGARLRKGVRGQELPTHAQRAVAACFRAGWLSLGTEVIERHGAQFGLESRHPFYDQRVVEFAMAIPEEQRRRRGQTKFVVRQAMRGLLPETVRLRPGKAEGSFMYWQALQALGGEKALDSLAIASAGWVDRNEVRRMYQEMAAADAGSSDGLPHVMAMWTILSLELWYSAWRSGEHPSLEEVGSARAQECRAGSAIVE
ncbi:MAG TPA: asparagine synthase (glutamine-hydrolyzing) [Terriglobia bacterium]|nr:asparagine synthase (glutamine-hydrolyzing) [Terriglobia bacterium]